MKERKKSPATAAVLNFFIWGLGYVYISKVWGIALIMLIIPLFIGQFTTGIVSGIQDAFYEFWALDWIFKFLILAVSVVLAWHAYGTAKEI